MRFLLRSVALGSLFFASLPPTASGQPTEGTYRVWLCKTACLVADSARAPTELRVVLITDSSARQPAARAEFARIRTRFEQRAANACFRTVRGRKGAPITLPFSGGNAVTSWLTASDSSGLLLNGGPDFSSSIRWWGAGAPATGAARTEGVGSRIQAFFVAQRVGPADPAQCVDDRAERMGRLTTVLAAVGFVVGLAAMFSELNKR
jgi:hypothetical protein